MPGNQMSVGGIDHDVATIANFAQAFGAKGRGVSLLHCFYRRHASRIFFKGEISGFLPVHLFTLFGVQ